MRHEGDSHWFLKHRKTGAILDPTVYQFQRPPDYRKAKARAFLTGTPSARAAKLMPLLLWSGQKKP